MLNLKGQDPTDPAANPGGAIVVPRNNPRVEDPDNPRKLSVRIYNFTIQFCWRETPLSVRLENERLAALAEAEGEFEGEADGEPEVLETEEEIGGEE